MPIQNIDYILYMTYFREALYKHGKRGYCSTQCKKRPLYLIRLKHTKHSLVEEGEIQISRTQIFAPISPIRILLDTKRFTYINPREWTP